MKMCEHKEKQFAAPSGDIVSKHDSFINLSKNIEDNSDNGLNEIIGSDFTLRARLKQIIMDTRDNFYLNSDLAEVEKDLDQMLTLEENEHLEDHDDFQKAEELRGSGRFSVVKRVDRKILELMNSITEVFSQIFQALLYFNDVLLLKKENHSETELTSRRSKEYEVRLNKCAFDLKQKNRSARVTLVKLKIHPSSKNLQKESDLCLHRSLRIVLNILKSYLGHLPLSGGTLFPRSLQYACEEMEKCGEVAVELGYDCSDFIKDVKRLKNASVNSKKKGSSLTQGKGERKDAEFVNRTIQKKKTLNLINNLAREKFGTGSPPQSPKKTNLKTNGKASGPTYSNKVISEFPHEQRKSDNNSSDCMRKSSNRVPVGNSDSSIFNPSPMTFADSFLTGKQKYRSDNIEKLELEDDELAHILRHRKKSTLVFENDAFIPISMINNVTEQLTDEVIEDVCHEIFNAGIVEELIRQELH